MTGSKPPKPRAKSAARPRARDAVAGALLYEVPVEKFVRFKNPLLAREVRGRFRLRQSGFLVSLGRFATLVIAIGFWLFIAYNASDPVTRPSAGGSLMMGICALGTLAVGVMSSNALVREREAGTWEGLHLSLLSAREIVRSKWLSPLVTLGYWATPFWILLPLSLSFGSLGALLIVAASMGTVSAWGLWISSRAPHSAAATSWTLVTLLVALLALPALDEILGVKEMVAPLFFAQLRDPTGLSTSRNPYRGGYYGYNPLGIDSDKWSTFQALWNSYHPFISIRTLTDKIAPDGAIRGGIVALNLTFNALVTSFLLWRVWKRLKKTEH